MNSLDIFGKFKDRQSASSVLGGMTSIIALACVILLVSIHLTRLRSENLHRELKIDFHAIDQHTQADIDITLYNAPCDIVTIDYRDALGEDIHDIHVSKTYLNKEGSDQNSPEYIWDAPVSRDSVRDKIKDWPGCRLRGKFNEIMKVKGALIVTFKDHFQTFLELKGAGENVNLEYNIDHLFFGNTEKNQRILETLKPYHEDIHSELNPFKNEKPHRDGNFLGFIYIQIFPFEVINDINKETLSSYQYSYIKNYKQISSNTPESPELVFNMDFLPIVSVYHIKVLPRFKAIIGILGACGGIFSVFGILSAVLKSFSKPNDEDSVM